MNDLFEKHASEISKKGIEVNQDFKDKILHKIKKKREEMAEENVALAAMNKYRKILKKIEIDEKEVLEMIFSLGKKHEKN